ncbi:hypothetical protein [Roseicyclus amphidinii]|uniref:hypothetical protein n=1 Tax=Roseicyclus amphidinii TaxID=3034232 RepID=UPI0024E05B4B|nr:hypothetical protein [Roseicyclus sp. Amp-Y-6]
MIRTTLFGLALSALTGPALAEPFTMLIYETPEDIALRSDVGAAGAAYWTLWAEYSAELAASGAVRGGAPLMIDEADGAALSGYFILEAASHAEAEALAASAPAALRDGRVVVVPHLAVPGMSN